MWKGYSVAALLEDMAAPAPVAAPARPALLTPCAMTPPLTHTGAWAVPPVASRTAEYVAVTSTFPAPDYIHIYKIFTLY